MNKEVSKQAILTSVLITIWIFVVNVVTPLITTAPPWPMFFVTIFFAVLGNDPKNIKMIALSGGAGILIGFILMTVLGIVAPIFGILPSFLVLLFIALGTIIIGGNWFPLFLNNITFGYLTICAIDIPSIPDMFVSWILMFIIGGVIILGGVFLLGMLAAKICAKDVNSDEVKEIV